LHKSLGIVKTIPGHDYIPGENMGAMIGIKFDDAGGADDGI